jgi:hypothetical protein
MVLARDLVTRDGVMLLAADFVLDESLIRQLRELEASEGIRLSIAIRPEAERVTPGEGFAVSGRTARAAQPATSPEPLPCPRHADSLPVLQGPGPACRSGGHGPGKQIALDQVAAPLVQGRQLGHGLDALGDHFQPQAVGQPDDRLDDGDALPVVQFIDKGAVDLQGIHGQPAQVGQGRIARAEIIHRHPHTHLAQLGQDARGVIQIAHQHRFGELELDARGRHAGLPVPRARWG